MSNQKVARAAKWSVFSEVLAKVIAPVTTIILARLLSQEIFGIVASLTAIASMADLLADAGFNAYIIQHQFKNEHEKKATFNICFWTNIFISCTLFLIIVFNRHFFSRLVGAEGYGDVLVIASLVIPMVSVSSIEMAIMKKELNFKSLGLIKIVSKLIPFFVTIPMAFWGFGYWSLVVGTLVGDFVGMILCVFYGRFYPSFIYPTEYLRSIFSFSLWAYLESILEWLISNVAVLVLATLYGMAALGVFKVAVNLVTQITSSVYALYANVYKSAIAREQFDVERFRGMFLTFQKYASIFSLPLGIGVFLFRDTATRLLLGENWMDASTLIGLYCLSCTMSISFGNFYSDAIRAKGYPKLLVIVDGIYLALIMLLLYSADYISFALFCIIFSILKIVQPLLQIIIGRNICNVSVKDVFRNSLPQLVASGSMIVVVCLLGLNGHHGIFTFVGILASVVVYITVFYLLTPDRYYYLKLLNNLKMRLMS